FGSLLICGCAALRDSSAATYADVFSYCEETKAGGSRAITDEERRLEIQLRDLSIAQMREMVKPLGYHSEEVYYPRLMGIGSSSSIHWFWHGDSSEVSFLFVQCESGKVIYVTFAH